MFRVLEVILLGGGSIGALSGWLLCRWLDARTAAVRRRVVGVAKHDAAAGERLAIELPPSRPFPVIAAPNTCPACGGTGDYRNVAACARCDGTGMIVLGPRLHGATEGDPGVFTEAAGPDLCGYLSGPHLCIMPRDHLGAHECECNAAPRRHLFS